VIALAVVVSVRAATVTTPTVTILRIGSLSLLNSEAKTTLATCA
jgi:hypothetical protein